MSFRVHVRRFTWRALPMAILAFAGAACAPTAPEAETERVVNVYTSRHYDADEQLYEAFTQATGIAVRTQEKSAEQLLAILQAEADQSPADVIVTVDAGNLYRLQEAGLLQPTASPALEEAVPARLRDPAGHWWGFSRRARVIAYRVGAVDPASVDTLAELTAPALRGQVCVRSSSNIYNLSMVAGLIEREGPDAARAWTAGLVANFARPPRGNDTDQLRAVAAGECDVAIVNHYYHLRLAASAAPEDRAVAQATAILFPDQRGAGAHVNISGFGMAAHAPHPEEAMAFMEFLVSPQAQALLAPLNEEFPVRADAPPTPGLAALGALQEEAVPLAALGRHQAQAAALMEEVGWP